VPQSRSSSASLRRRLYAMAGPGFLPTPASRCRTAKVAIMGPQAAINAVYANKIAETPTRTSGRRSSRPGGRSFEQDVDLLRLASDLCWTRVEPTALRSNSRAGSRRWWASRGTGRRSARGTAGMSAAPVDGIDVRGGPRRRAGRRTGRAGCRPTCRSDPGRPCTVARNGSAVRRTSRDSRRTDIERGTGDTRAMRDSPSAVPMPRAPDDPVEVARIAANLPFVTGP